MLNNDFNILYLVQGDYRSKLEDCYKQIKDLIYLSYKEKLPGNNNVFFIINKYIILYLL